MTRISLAILMIALIACRQTGDEAKSERVPAQPVEVTQPKRVAEELEKPQPAPVESKPAKESVEKTIDRLIDEGFNLMKQRKHNEAIARFQEAVKVAPVSVEARVYLAFGFLGAERRREAAIQLREAEKIDVAKANRYVTGMLKLPQSDKNLRNFLAALEKY